MKRFTVYKTVNLLNQMFYIGVHKTDDPNDDYLGSGKRLGYAINKYGVENFKKEILAIFETKEKAYELEGQLVTEEVLDSGKCYNLKLGGLGGFDHVVANINHKMWATKGGKIRREKQILRFKEDSEYRAKISAKLSASAKRRHAINGFGKKRSFLGHKHSEATKLKMSILHSARVARDGNSQTGTCWVTKEGMNRKIQLSDFPTAEQAGWQRGRIMQK